MSDKFKTQGDPLSQVPSSLKGNREPRCLADIMEHLSRPTLTAPNGDVLAREYVVRNVMLVPEELYNWVEKNHRKAERFRGWRIAACYAVEELAGTNEMYFIPETGDELVQLKFEDKYFDKDEYGLQDESGNALQEKPIDSVDNKEAEILQNTHDDGTLADN